MLRTLLGVSLILTLFAGTPLVAANNLIRNGSFENPVVPLGSYELFTLGQTFPGWAVVGASGNVAIVSGSFTQNGYTFPAQSGVQGLDLTGTSNTATGVQQIVPTTSGQTYTLSFYVGNVYNPGGIFGISSTVKVMVNGTNVFTATNSMGQGGMVLVWQRF
jgi:hypothetical protein